jgi:hypothetical protein
MIDDIMECRRVLFIHDSEIGTETTANLAGSAVGRFSHLPNLIPVHYVLSRRIKSILHIRGDQYKTTRLEKHCPRGCCSEIVRLATSPTAGCVVLLSGGVQDLLESKVTGTSEVRISTYEMQPRADIDDFNYLKVMYAPPRSVAWSMIRGCAGKA